MTAGTASLLTMPQRCRYNKRSINLRLMPNPTRRIKPHLWSWPDREPSSNANMAVVPSLAFASAACCRNAASVANTARRAACCRASSNATSVAAGSRLHATQAPHCTHGDCCNAGLDYLH